MMRKLLLGDDANDEGDDFFLDDHDDDRDDENDDDDMGDVHKVMSSMPKDEDSYDEETATPAEAAKRKRLQKKLNKKEREDSVSEKPETAAKKSKKGDKGKRLVDSEDKNEEDHQQDSTQQLELLFAGEENETVDRLKFSKNEFEKLQKTKGSSKRQKKRKRSVSLSLPPSLLLLTYPALLWSLVEFLRLKKILSSKWISMMIGSERSYREPILTMVLILWPMNTEPPMACSNC
jgi:hypothetical protein